MGSVLVVVREPVWQGRVAGAAVSVAQALGPLAFHRLVEALHLPVPARCVGRRDDVADAALGEQFAQTAIAGIAPGAVSHDSARADAVAGERGQGELGE